MSIWKLYQRRDAKLWHAVMESLGRSWTGRYYEESFLNADLVN